MRRVRSELRFQCWRAALWLRLAILPRPARRAWLAQDIAKRQARIDAVQRQLAVVGRR